MQIHSMKAPARRLRSAGSMLVARMIVEPSSNTLGSMSESVWQLQRGRHTLFVNRTAYSPASGSMGFNKKYV